MFRFKKSIIALLTFAVVGLAIFAFWILGRGERISGSIVDVVNSEIYPGTLVIKGR